MSDSTTLTFRARVGSDLTSSRTNRGILVVRFRIAVPQWRRTDSGDYQDLEPRWYTVRAWDRLAQHVATSLSKGQPIIVVGRPVANAWLDTNGQIHAEMVINAHAIGHDLNAGSTMFFKRGQAPTADTAAEHTDSISLPTPDNEGNTSTSPTEPPRTPTGEREGNGEVASSVFAEAYTTGGAA